MLTAKGIRNPVLSFEEIGTNARPAVLGARLMRGSRRAPRPDRGAVLAGFILVFVRVGAIAALLPGFGEQVIPARVRLGVAFAFALVVWPMVAARRSPRPTRRGRSSPCCSSRRRSA